ncbi:btaf1 RNA polymerase II, B-TFIID transcription factor-associated, 170kDa, partial [Nowakowskiella sp. JEL0078]
TQPAKQKGEAKQLDTKKWQPGLVKSPPQETLILTNCRLDRLVLLLDTGSTAAIRATAARQLGDIQKQLPDELYNLLARVLVHLRSKSWDTRTAASQAIAAIAANVPLWNPAAACAATPSPPAASDESKLAFDAFDLASVLSHGAPLLANPGSQYDDFGDMDHKERMRLLRDQIGLGATDPASVFVDLHEEMELAKQGARVSPKATIDAQKILDKAAKDKKQNLQVEAKDEEDVDMSGLSARERIALKRKRKLAATKDKSA